ncbi:coiled-coil domain-containing protein 81 isoform X2 [Rhinatrema bivittatum]|uniref:coiled-coil domain-containing protein 81 isoform X2 n=1 Tax=Rhinatrema bivittatum TaxID=194408 RepID=UPI00112D1522|nr:coiled-coil domain-containing protein 81 isoform X2 [Rhinatrema bivittatum]
MRLKPPSWTLFTLDVILSSWGVQIPGLGTFTLSRQKQDVGNKCILIQRPVFHLSEKLAQTHGLKHTKIYATGDIPIVQLNYVALSLWCMFDRDIVEGCVRETLQVLSQSIATKKSVEFNFKGIGLLIFRDCKVKMKFYKEFLNSMDGSGNLVQALSNRPGTCDSVMSGRESIFRPRSCNTIEFPRIELKDLYDQMLLERIDEEKEVGGRQQQIKLCEQLVNEENNEEVHSSDKRVFTSDRRLLNRQCIVPAKVTGINLLEDLERHFKSKPVLEKLTTSFSPNGPKADGDGTNNHIYFKAQMPLVAQCLDHCRAGQELCYLCMQRARKNIPVSFAEERKRKEQEEERQLHKYQIMKQQEAIQKMKLDSLAKKESNQKIAAYNLGIAEAIKHQKNEKPFEINKSYIFRKRPPTPSPCIKQGQHAQCLLNQLENKKEKEKRSRQDKELLDRLEQVQLAEELAAQKANYKKEKTEQMLGYKNALETQLKMKPLYLPVFEPDTSATLFGKNDATHEKIVEKKQRACDTYKQQLQAVAERKTMAVLNELIQQRKEAEILERSKQEMLADKIAQFDKMHSLQESLKKDWMKNIELKRQRDCEERQFLKADSKLLIDQFETYQRCRQCKRRTTNCGESNLWCHSKYLPGSRLII